MKLRDIVSFTPSLNYITHGSILNFNYLNYSKFKEFLISLKSIQFSFTRTYKYPSMKEGDITISIDGNGIESPLLCVNKIRWYGLKYTGEEIDTINNISIGITDIPFLPMLEITYLLSKVGDHPFYSIQKYW